MTPPKQARGRQRLEKILDAADAVMQRQDSAALNMQEVAQEAGLPPASLYHYVSGSQALLLELAHRHLAGFELLARQPVAHDALSGWPDLCRILAGRALDFYRAHPVAMRLLLGPESGWQIRSADLEANRRIGALHRRRLVQHFCVADSDSLARACAISITIGDSIWALSFAREGDVTPDMAEESLRARIAYLRLYIGEHAEKRPEPLP